MTDAPAPSRYTRTAIVLHWLIAALIVVNVALALSADALPDDWARPVIDTHKSTGITVLGLLALRLLWRIGHPPPALPRTHARWQRAAAYTVHGTLYTLMLLLPLSGWLHDSAWKDAATHPMHWYGLFPWPRIGFIAAIEPVAKESLHTLFGWIHTGLGYLLYGLLVLHVGGAVKHQLVDREPKMQRMSW